MPAPEYEVLHVIGPDCHPGASQTLEALLTGLPAGQKLISIGSAPTGLSHCTSHNLTQACRWLPVVGRWQLRRLVSRLAGGPGDRPTILHVWIESLVPPLLRSAPRGLPLVVQATQNQAARKIWHAGQAAARLLRWVCPTETLKALVIEHGLDPSCVVTIRESFDPSSLATMDRAALRQQCGLRPADNAIAVLGQLIGGSGAFLAAWAGMLAEKINANLRLILPENGREAQQVRYLAACCRHEHMFFFAKGLRTVELVSLADLAVYVPPGEAHLTDVMWAMAAGCPIVASDVPANREVLSAGQTAWMCRPGDPKDAARAILRALESPGTSRQYAEQAQQVAARVFSRQRMLAEYDRLYRELAEKPTSRATVGTPRGSAASGPGLSG
jgi:glycosyltransferase involved in cell wall biosynthesis